MGPLVRLARCATSAVKPAISPVNAPPWIPTARLRPEKFMKEALAFFEEMDQSTKRTMDLAEKCRKEMDVESKLPGLPNMLDKGVGPMKPA